MNRKSIINEILQELLNEKNLDLDKLRAIKSKISKKYKIKDYPKNTEIISAYLDYIEKNKEKVNNELLEILKKKKRRSLSGIVSLTLLFKPYPCSAKCIYCPTQDNVPKSYISNEPAVQRALAVKYDAYKQTKARLEMYRQNGHNTSKIEVILLGGTFSDYPKKYITSFVKKILQALNDSKKTNLYDLQKENAEISIHKMVGLTIENRPDKININEIKYMRKIGVTKVELGVQSLDDEILKKNIRNCTVKQIIQATKLLKDAGFKICYHMMLNMPFSDIETDYQQFIKLFEDPSFRPDYLKIYPCVVAHNQNLKKMVENGIYKLYSDEELINLIKKIKKNLIPRYIRIIRIYRDIPIDNIDYGSTISNLREYLSDVNCQCIRCREIKDLPIINYKLNRYDYDASDGKEIFLTIDETTQDKLIALLRLRIPSYYFSGKKHFIKDLQDTAIIRELHSYGQQIPVGQYDKKSAQHQGFGTMLLNEAQKIVLKEYNIKKISVISGIGVRKYYEKHGFILQNPKYGYMIKKLI